MQRLTVKHLKEILATWPDFDRNGRHNEVWMATGFALSARVNEVEEVDDGDILFDCGVWPNPGDGWDRRDESD